MKALRHQCGFTLIELMIVIAIIGVLAGIAIPSMSKQVARSQISRVYSELSHYRNSIEDFLLTGDQSLLASDAKGALNFVDSDLSSVVFGSFADASASTVTATLDGRTSSLIHGTKVTLARDAGGSWTCIVVGAGGGWNDSLKPNACN